jgi:nicotinate dehydrogenase subunit B
MSRDRHDITDIDNELVADGPTTFPVDRRDFVKLTATGLLVLFSVDRASALQETERVQTTRQGYPTDLNAYVHVGADGRVTCFTGKIEMGQGTQSSLPQLVAEQLDVPLSNVDIVMGDTDLCPWDMGTFGSLSVRQFGPILMQAAAEARQALVQMAAEKLEAPADRLVIKAGVISDPADPKKSVAFGQLTAGKRIERKIEGKPPLKPLSAYKVMGTSAPRRDAIDKVTGKAKYAGDLVPAGAVHARILRPPAHGAKLGPVDTAAAEKVPGVKVVRDGEMVAVLHEHRDEADKALALVKAEWARNDGPVTEENLHEHLVKDAPAGRTIAQGGSLAEGEKAAAGGLFEHAYLDSYVAHAPMETHAAVATVENGKVTVWAATQTPFPLKNQLMQALRLPADKVRVITPYVGGGFGGKSASRQAVEAARLAVLTGRPVRVVWSREEEFFYDTFHPAAVIKLRSGIDGAGRIVMWDYAAYGAGERGAEHTYDIPNHKTTSAAGWGGGNPDGYHPFAVGAWRGPGANTNTFARESQVDIMAARAGIDPVEFRLKNLKDARMIRVLNAAAKKFGWTPRASRRAPAAGGAAVGVGVACGSDAGSYVTLMAEVSVDRASGAVKVKRIVCAQEMGVVVNPEGALQQIEGCLVMGLGYTFSEEVHFKGTDVLDRSFSSYELPRFSWVPTLEAVIVDAPEVPSQGGGEPAIVPVGAVMANAIHDAVGTRLFRMPMTPARVKAAML